MFFFFFFFLPHLFCIPTLGFFALQTYTHSACSQWSVVSRYETTPTNEPPRKLRAPSCFLVKACKHNAGGFCECQEGEPVLKDIELLLPEGMNVTAGWRSFIQ